MNRRSFLARVLAGAASTPVLTDVAAAPTENAPLEAPLAPKTRERLAEVREVKVWRHRKSGLRHISYNPCAEPPNNIDPTTGERPWELVSAQEIKQDVDADGGAGLALGDAVGIDDTGSVDPNYAEREKVRLAEENQAGHRPYRADLGLDL